MNPLGAAVAVLLLLIAVIPCQAADISVASAPGMKGVLDDLGPKFEALSGHRSLGAIPDPWSLAAANGERRTF